MHVSLDGLLGLHSKKQVRYRSRYARFEVVFVFVFAITKRAVLSRACEVFPLVGFFQKMQH